jgi:hypothetical protein
VVGIVEGDDMFVAGRLVARCGRISVTDTGRSTGTTRRPAIGF